MRERGANEPRWPTCAAVVYAAAYVTAVQTGIYHPSGNSVADALVFVIGAPVTAVISALLGSLCGRIDGLVGVAVLTAALQWGDPNPLPAMITVGFWLIGLAVGSHRRMARVLRVRALELDSGRAAYTRAAVRYESTRIARELHDIVAHNLTVIVIHASAGRRLPADGPDPDELFDTIIELADQARVDVSGLSRLLDRPGESTVVLTPQTLDDLLARSTATGSPITCDPPEGLDQLPGRLGAVLYRIVQEGLTNAIKHAPGAAIHVTFATVAPAADVSVVITNAPPGPNAVPTAPGSGRGIIGLTERVRAAHGTFVCGPSPEGGWQLRVSLPRNVSDDGGDAAVPAAPSRTARLGRSRPTVRMRTSRSAP